MKFIYGTFHVHIWKFFKKFRIELPYDPATPLLGDLPPKFENIYLQSHVHPCVYCSIIHGGQAVETPEVSFSRGLDKVAVLQIDSGIVLSPKKR